MSKKIELVLKTYELLKTTKPSDLKIRTIAASCNCTSTVIYKHFENLDHLVCFACVRFLEDYIIEFQKIIDENSDYLEMLVAMWKAFAKYGFANIDVFQELFWGKFKANLGDTIFEYYQMFPDNWKNLDGLFTTVFFNNELKERNYTILHRATMAGYFSIDDDRMLSDIECNLFHGLLLEYRDKYRIPGKAQEGAAYFMKMLDALHSHFRLK